MRSRGCACFLALVVSVLADTTDRDCANWDVDIFARPTQTWCYIRMYRCHETPRTPSLGNKNTGDLAWGAGGKKLGIMTCSGYGKYLQVWRVQVKRDLLITKRRYSQCNNNVCGCGLNGKCGDKKPAVNFGWRYKDQGSKDSKNSKRQFSLPKSSRKEQWEELCLERAVTTDCIKKTTTNEDNMASVAAIFKRDVIDNPIDGCQSVTPVKLCTPSVGQIDQFFEAQETSKRQGKQECRAREGEVCQAQEEESDRVEEEDKEEEAQEGWEEEEEEVRRLKWRWTGHSIPSIGEVPRAWFEDKWNMPTDRTALVKEIEKKLLRPEAAAKHYETRSVEFADADYPERRRTFANYVEALDWLLLEENI